MAIIVPSILEKKSDGVEQKLKLIKGLTRRFQLDIIDGWPSGEDTLTLSDFSGIKERLDFKLEVHLMVKEPADYLLDCQKTGAGTVIGQIELMDSQEDFISRCKSLNLKAGLAVDLPTFLDKLDRKLLFQLDCCLLMAIAAGAQGRQFDQGVLGKLKRLARIRKDLGAGFIISIDGGITPDMARRCRASGADQLCVGSYLFKAPDIRRAWQELNRPY